MQFHLNGYIRRHTSRQLLADLKKTAAALNQDTISNKQYRHTGAYCPSVIIRRFRTWNNALQKAGLKIKKHYNIPVSLLFSNLRRLWHALGRQPYLSDLYPPLSRFGRRPYLRAFGKWSIALEKFVASHHKSEKTQTKNARSSTLPPAESLSRSSGSNRNGPPSWRLRYLVMKRDNFRCSACGASPATNPAITLHIDHIIPSSKGGQSIPANLQTLCSTCNIGKSNL